MNITAIPRSHPTKDATVMVVGKSAASWPAMAAGALITIAASLILFAIGSGLGFASLSSGHMLGTTFLVTTAIWLITSQWISAGLGGYMAGRLRSRWYADHTRKIFFRDAVRGLMTWVVAMIVVAALVGPAVSSMISDGVAANAAATYDLTGLPALAQNPADADGVTVGPYRIMGNTLATGGIPIIDRSSPHVALVPVTGMSRIRLLTSEWPSTGAAEAIVFGAIALLIGAYIASVAAGLGGVFRDEHP